MRGRSAFLITGLAVASLAASTARIFIARVQAASWKAARKRRSDLERDLTRYATPADRDDLEAILDRYPYGTTHELRGILARQSMADDIRSRHPSGTPSRRD